MRPKILVLAYAVNPERGSEPGVGWAWTRMLASFADVWLVTGSRLFRIEPALAEIPGGDRVRMTYVDAPRWSHAFWRRGRRFMRLHYLLWLGTAREEARRLHREVGFDLVWHVTFANLWLGSSGGKIGPPFILGPVGGGVGTPWRLAPGLGARGVAYEIARNAGRWWGRLLNPRARSAWRSADRILAGNHETLRWLPSRHRPKAQVWTNVTLDEGPSAAQRRGGEVALFASRVAAWKGAWLAVRALVHAPGWRLIVCGEGADMDRTRALASRLGVADRVELRGWLDRTALRRVMEDEADVLVHPSLHDDGAVVIAEAISSGLPIVCLDRGGPRLVAGDAATVVPSRGGVRKVSRALGEVLGSHDLADPEAVIRRAKELSIETTAERLRELTDEVLGAPGGPR